MNVLFIGGTGNISTACVRLGLEKGLDIHLLTRGKSPRLFDGRAELIVGDIRDRVRIADTLKDREFDAVVDWVAYLPEHVETDIAIFRRRIKQYVFISSATVYQKPPQHYPISESTPLGNPFWQYARDKIACEERLLQASREEGFPITIVRPSLTFGETWIPCAVGGHDFTVIDRMKKGREVIVHGDGQSLWTITHNTDFAKGLIGLLGNPAAIGESFHITADEVLTWDRIYRAMGHAAGVEPKLIHIPSEFINLYDARIGAGLLGDKAFSAVFDNSKIKRAVPEFQAVIPFSEGIRMSLRWFEAEAHRMVANEAMNQLMDRIVRDYRSAWPR
jgi:nucleoside-diphosphate-sugar epimerase